MQTLSIWGFGLLRWVLAFPVSADLFGVSDLGFEVYIVYGLWMMLWPEGVVVLTFLECCGDLRLQQFLGV